MGTLTKVSWLTSAKRRPLLLYRKNLIRLFTQTEHLKEDRGIIIKNGKPEIGKVYDTHITIERCDPEKEYAIYDDGEYLYGMETGTDGLVAICLQSSNAAAYDIYEQFQITPDDIENYSGQGEFTTYGRYIVNYFALASVFGNAIPYHNDIMNIGKIELVIGRKALINEVTAEQLTKYLDHMFFIGSFAELSVPVFSKKALTTDPNIAKRKAELLAEHSHELDDPVVGAKIEDELIQMDKDWLKGDPAMGFYASASKKFNVHRKRQFLAVGLVDEFSKEKGKYTFLPGALADGWEKDAFPDICNDIRKASYNRGIETALGGVQTKYLLRVFQSTVISSEDCGTKRGLLTPLTPDNIASFYGFNVILPNGKLETLTTKNASKFINTTVRLRSVMYCEEKNGFCFTCAGDFYRNLDIKALGALALEVGSAFLLLSMKAMHGTKLSSFEVDDLDQFVI